MLNNRHFESKFHQTSISVGWDVSSTDHHRHLVSTWRRRRRSNVHYVQYVVYVRLCVCLCARGNPQKVGVGWWGSPGWINLHNAAHVRAPVVIRCSTLIHIHWFVWIHIEITGKQMISGVHEHGGNSYLRSISGFHPILPPLPFYLIETVAAHFGFRCENRLLKLCL